MKIALTVPGIPVAQPRQRHRVFKVGDRTIAQNYTPTDDPVNAFKASVKLFAAAVCPDEPLAGPVRLTLTFLFPRPKYLDKGKGPWPRVYHDKKPDRDNLEKSVQDALTGIMYADDSQIAVATTSKFYAAAGEQPKTIIEVASL